MSSAIVVCSRGDGPVASHPSQIVGPVPTPGQHTDEVLSRILGYDGATLDQLRQEKVIA